MTKLTHIEELAEQCNPSIGYIAGTMPHPSNRTYTYTKSELESLRQAIISDFVSKLEPVLFEVCVDDEILHFDRELTAYEQGNNAEVLPLFDLSEWKTK